MEILMDKPKGLLFVAPKFELAMVCILDQVFILHSSPLSAQFILVLERILFNRSTCVCGATCKWKYRKLLVILSFNCGSKISNKNRYGLNKEGNFVQTHYDAFHCIVRNSSATIQLWEASLQPKV